MRAPLDYELTDGMLSQDFSALARRFYDAAIDDAEWADVVADLKRRLDLSRVGLGWLDLPQSAFETGASNMLHSDCGPQYERLFFEFGSENPFVARMAVANIGQVISERTLLDRDAFVSSALYNEWFAPLGDHSAAAVKLEHSDHSQALLMVQRGAGQPLISARDEADLLALAPSLVHALSIRRRLGENRLRLRGNAYDQVGVGFAVTDERGTLLQCNATAERYFGAELGLTLKANRVLTDHPSQLARMITTAASLTADLAPGGDLVVTHGDMETPTLAVSVAPISDGPRFGLPVPRGAMLVMQHLAKRLPDDFERRTQNLFGLTAKEASLAAALCSGISVSEAATERFISMPTARTQLASIFRKTGTAQQSQLVSLLLRVLPVTR